MKRLLPLAALLRQTLRLDIPMKPSAITSIAHSGAAVAISLLAGCTPPKPDFQTRKAALNHCLSENEKALKEILAEAKLIKDNRELFDRKREDFYDNFKWSFMHTDKWTKVEITQAYCKPSRSKKWPEIGYLTGYIESIERPNDGKWGETKVEKVISSYPSTFTWDSE